MRPLSHTLPALQTRCWRVVIGAGLYLCLLLLGAGAQASSVARSEAMAVVASGMSSDSMPNAVDCAPCARCYVAPAPVALEISGESIETNAPYWQVHATVQVDTVWTFDAGVWHPRLPVRIAFSKWLN